LKKNINNIAVLINRASKVLLLAIDLNEDFVNEERVAKPTVISLQSTRIF